MVVSGSTKPYHIGRIKAVKEDTSLPVSPKERRLGRGGFSKNRLWGIFYHHMELPLFVASWPREKWKIWLSITHTHT